MLDKTTVNQEEEAIRLAIREFPDETRARIYADITASLRDPDTYAVLNYSLVAGLHHFYLGKYLRGVLEFAGFLLGVYLIYRGGVEAGGHMIMYFGIALVAVLIVVELMELFRAQIVVQDYNNRISRQVLANHSAVQTDP